MNHAEKSIKSNPERAIALLKQISEKNNAADIYNISSLLAKIVIIEGFTEKAIITANSIFDTSSRELCFKEIFAALMKVGNIDKAIEVIEKNT